MSPSVPYYSAITSQHAHHQSTLASVILFLLSLSLAKCSVLALILRIISSNTGKSRLFCISLMVTSAVWGVGSSAAFLINCRADTFLTRDNVKQCPNQVWMRHDVPHGTPISDQTPNHRIKFRQRAGAW